MNTNSLLFAQEEFDSKVRTPTYLFRTASWLCKSNSTNAKRLLPDILRLGIFDAIEMIGTTKEVTNMEDANNVWYTSEQCAIAHLRHRHEIPKAETDIHKIGCEFTKLCATARQLNGYFQDSAWLLEQIGEDKGAANLKDREDNEQSWTIKDLPTFNKAVQRFQEFLEKNPFSLESKGSRDRLEKRVWRKLNFLINSLTPNK